LILLDTNVLSELVRPKVDPVVLTFLRQQPQPTLFTSSVCQAEIRFGLARMPAGRRRNELARRFSVLFARFTARILAFDSTAAAFYGRVRAAREAAGRPIEVEDAMIAATARAFGVAVATRNIADFDGCGVHVVNPWAEEHT